MHSRRAFLKTAAKFGAAVAIPVADSTAGAQESAGVVVNEDDVIENAATRQMEEAGCKVVVGTCLKRAGMHWTTASANAIIALRCYRLSGRFQDFWEHRPNRRAA